MLTIVQVFNLLCSYVLGWAKMPGHPDFFCLC